MENKQLTPVEWFLNELLESNIINMNDVDIDSYNKAKEMEKQEIKDALKTDLGVRYITDEDCENYYQKTYGVK